jgi:LuxR family maltose regulon positive regulatory protein
LARLSLATGASSNALTLLESAISDYRNCGLIFPSHRLSVLSLIALRQRGGTESEAVSRMESLLQFIVDEGATRLILEHGDALESLLHVAQRRNRELILSSAQRDTTSRLLASLHTASTPGAAEFSSREIAVLRELCSGSSNKTIGQLLDLSENTVKFHLKRIFKKLDVDSRAAAIGAALQRGIVDAQTLSRAAQK